MGSKFVLHFTYDSGLMIHEVLHGIDDYVVITEFYGEEHSKKRKCRINYGRNDSPYFTTKGKRYYLNEFMAVGEGF